MTDQRERARVARYDLVDVTRCGEGWREMQRDDDYGEWVTYEDYVAAWADAERAGMEKAAGIAEREWGNNGFTIAKFIRQQAQAGEAKE